MFRDDFVWGVASSAYQIEGRDENDGAGACIWDSFAKKRNLTYDASVACDHIHRYKEDFALMRLLGIKAYRFSISWARLMPEGKGRVNHTAVEMYRDMIKCMKDNGIEPYITLYHWELPQALEDEGGWLNENIIDYFAEYAKAAAENFSDLSRYFITLNEPQCFVGLGYLSGVHAPGLKLSPKEVFQTAHNALRAHGKAVISLRKYARQEIKIGYAPTCGVACPYTESSRDIEAARNVYFGFDQPVENWTWNVSWFTDPVLLGKYPEEGLKKFSEYLPDITDEDMELIHQPIDFLGQNIYNGYTVRMGADNKPEYVERECGHPKTATNWPVTPECLYWGTRFLHERYHMPIYITENGMSCHDQISADGQIYDFDRIAFYDKYLSMLQKAYDEGVDIRGYFAWTFLDNFEWDKAYNERFGMVYVDFTTQKRTAKASAYWYQEVCDTNGANLSINLPEKEIIFLEPVFKKMPWGGGRLSSEWNYPTDSDGVGECWGISAHPNGDCIIREGRYKGKSLSSLWSDNRADKSGLFGYQNQESFPILAKIIDAKQSLSIQVHPDDVYAAEHENGSYGKCECWYVLDAPENAELIIGHNAKSKKELREMIESGSWDSLLRKIPVEKGDFIQIDPGTVHAITGGLEILEIQQSSDITYRVYDYDRLSDGKKRPLHIEKSLDVITVPAIPAEESVKKTGKIRKNTMELLGETKYFREWIVNVDKKCTIEHTNSFMLMSVIEGDGLVDGRMVKKGDFFILPYGYNSVNLRGSMQIIASAPVE